MPTKFYRSADLLQPVSRRPDTINNSKSEIGERRSEAQNWGTENFRGHEERRKESKSAFEGHQATGPEEEVDNRKRGLIKSQLTRFDTLEVELESEKSANAKK